MDVLSNVAVSINLPHLHLLLQNTQKKYVDGNMANDDDIILLSKNGNANMSKAQTSFTFCRFH